MWNYNFRNNQTHPCTTMRPRLSRQLEGDLPPAAAEELAAHLADCSECRRWAGAEQALHKRLLAEVEPPWIMPPAARAYNRSQIRRRLRRKNLMVQTRQTVRGLAALVMLLLFTAGLFWWWQNYDLESLAPINTPIPQETEQVTITLAVEGSSLSRYQPLIEAFEQENPHIRVRLVNTSEVADPDESGIRALATSFDVFPYSPNRQGESQYLLDLRPLLDLDPQFEPADFLPGLLSAPLEPLWAIPTGAAYYVTFYDQSAFEAANLLPPELDWTTDDFLDAALALTVREGNEVTRWGYVPGQMRYPPLLATQLTGPLTTPDGSPRLADPDVVAAVQWLGDLFTLHQVSPWLDDYRPAERRTGSGGQTAQALINSGQATMWHFTHLLFDANDENVGVTAVPHGPHGLAAEPIIYGFAASRGTAHPEAAWQLLHFLSRQPSQDSWADLITPARRSVAAANSYWEQLPDSLTPALQYTAENNSPPRISFQAANLLQEAISAHIDDDMPAAVALGKLPPPTAAPPETETEVVIVPTIPAEADEESVQINFYTSVTSAEAHRLLANQFHRENPDIRVEILEEAIRLNAPQESLLNRIATSDCFVGTSSDLADSNLRAVLLPIGPFLDLDTSLQANAFYPALLNELTLDGELLGLPGGVRIPYIEYNRRLFQEAGVPEPSTNWTLADFLEIAQQLTMGEGESKQYGFADQFAHVLFIRGIDGLRVQLLDESNTVPHFNYETAAELVTWYADLVRLYEVQPWLNIHLNPDFSQFETLLREERVAMWPGGAPNYIHFMPRPFPNIDIGVATEPLVPDGHEASLSVDAYYILADSSQPAACWEWIKFLVRQPSAIHARPQLFRLLPGHIETAESEEYITLVGEELAAVGHAYINNLPPNPPPSLPSWMDRGIYWLIQAYYAVASGESDVASALAEAEAKFSQYRQCIIERDAFNKQAEWSECAATVR
ncbi:MAG: extracellular solute-binding protein [Chloroflexota bacterium]